MFGPIINSLVVALGWRKAFLVLGGIMLLICFLAMTFSNNVEKADENNSGLVANKHIHPFQGPLYKNPVFVVITLSACICMFGEYIPQVHIVSCSVRVRVICAQDLVFCFPTTLCILGWGQRIKESWATTERKWMPMFANLELKTSLTEKVWPWLCHCIGIQTDTFSVVLPHLLEPMHAETRILKNVEALCTLWLAGWISLMSLLSS